MEHKSTISKFLFEKAKSDLLVGIEANRKKLIDEEIQIGINVNLLLGIALEGIVNQLGEKLFGKNYWDEIEKSNSFSKWFIVLKLNHEDVDKGKEPFQIILKLKKMRDEIAHPKLKVIGDDVILVSEKGDMMKNPNEDSILPTDDLNVYIGYEKFIEKYNIDETLKNMKKVLETIIDVKKLLPDEFTWCDAIYNEIKNIRIE
jgi:hypothetical protein